MSGADDKKALASGSKSNRREDQETILDAISSDFARNGPGAVLARECMRLQANNLGQKAQIRRQLALLAIVVAFAATTISLLFVFYPKVRWIPTSDAAAICEINGETAPRIDTTDITEFAKDAVVALNSYDYVNYRDEINLAVQTWLDGDGRINYLRSLDESGNLERVIKGRLILKAMTLKVPQIEETGNWGIGKHYWVVQVPITIEFYSGGEEQPKSRQDFLAALTVVQVPTTKGGNRKGILGHSLVLKPYVRS